MKQFLHKLFDIESFRVIYHNGYFLHTTERREYSIARDLAKIFGGEVVFDPK